MQCIYQKLLWCDWLKKEEECALCEEWFTINEGKFIMGTNVSVSGDAQLSLDICTHIEIHWSEKRMLLAKFGWIW